MLRYISILLFSCFFCVCHAQEIETNVSIGYHKRAQRVIETDDLGFMHFYEFDKHGRLIKRITNKDRDLRHPMRDSLHFPTTFYTYDDKLLVREDSYFYDGLHSIKEYKYEKNKVVKRIITDPDGSIFELHYVYKDDKLVYETRMLPLDVNWGYVEYTYDDKLGLTTTHDCLSIERPCSCTKKYQTQLHIREEYWDTDESNQLVLQSYDETFYDRKGKLVKWVSKLQNDDVPDTGNITYKNGKRSKMLIFREGAVIHEYFYDGNGNLTNIKNKNGDNEIYKYTYNEKGDVILKEWVEKGKDKWQKNEITYY
ncbi:hypothetical protein ACLI09_03085 [Flavobacterium sp. RHBU_24]|uniref:hypothetical protein n=1 Tax=Flavobacterium sp. RHBU_24 TaxID=3391185 RepID=UPI003984C82D